MFSFFCFFKKKKVLHYSWGLNWCTDACLNGIVTAAWAALSKCVRMHVGGLGIHSHNNESSMAHLTISEAAMTPYLAERVLLLNIKGGKTRRKKKKKKGTIMDWNEWCHLGFERIHFGCALLIWAGGEYIDGMKLLLSWLWFHFVFGMTLLRLCKSSSYHPLPFSPTTSAAKSVISRSSACWLPIRKSVKKHNQFSRCICLKHALHA